MAGRSADFLRDWRSIPTTASTKAGQLSEFGQQRSDHPLGLRLIAAAKEIHVVEYMVELVKRPALLEAARQWPGFPVRRDHARGEAAEQLHHREVAFPIAIMNRGVE